MKKTRKRIRASAARKSSVKPRATASVVKANSLAGGPASRWFKPWVEWATLRGNDSCCLWGKRESDAVENCDPDERVALVRVEVLEILDE